MRDLKVVVIGGGTGSFTLLSGLKNHVDDLTAIVNMSDDGGSTGILRDELGVLPPGDLRQCLVALSESPKVRNLFNYRFDDGTFGGHSFGNLFISTVEKMTNSSEEAIELAGEILRIKGRVVPVTTEKTRLVLRQQDGEVVKGQFKIGHLHFAGRSRPDVFLEPSAVITEEGKHVLESADLIVIAPGNLYGSLAPALVVGGVREALEATSATIVYVCNLVTKPNQTDGFKVHDYADEIERFIGSEVLDYVIYNNDRPDKDLEDKYTHDGERIVEFDEDIMGSKHYLSVGLPLIAKEISVYDKADKLAQVRSLIRHDQETLAARLISLIES